jgi:hypothetical protein
MSELEDLKERKEQLLLEREVAKLERRKRFDHMASRWSWYWVAPLALIGAVFIVMGIDDINRIVYTGEPLIILILGFGGVTPLIFKLLTRR